MNIQSALACNIHTEITGYLTLCSYNVCIFHVIGYGNNCSDPFTLGYTTQKKRKVNLHMGKTTC